MAAEAAPEYGSMDDIATHFAVNPAHILEIVYWMQDRADRNEFGLSMGERAALLDIADADTNVRKMQRLQMWIREDGTHTRMGIVLDWIQRRRRPDKPVVKPDAKPVPAPLPLPPPPPAPVRSRVVLTRSFFKEFFGIRPGAMRVAIDELLDERADITLHDIQQTRSAADALLRFQNWTFSSERSTTRVATWITVRGPDYGIEY